MSGRVILTVDQIKRDIQVPFDAIFTYLNRASPPCHGYTNMDIDQLATPSTIPLRPANERISMAQLDN